VIFGIGSPRSSVRIEEENKQIKKEQKFKLFVRRSEESDEDDKEAGDEKQ
jgi:hypothetical protein